GMRRALLGLGFALALAACQETDPTTEARRVCVNAEAESEARVAACTTLIETEGLSTTDRAAAFANRGDATREAGDVTAALRDYNAALEVESNTMLAALGKAEILLESGQLDAAEVLVRRLLDSGQFGANAHYLAGRIAFQRGELDTALEHYNQAIAA